MWHTCQKNLNVHFYQLNFIPFHTVGWFAVKLFLFDHLTIRFISKVKSSWSWIYFVTWIKTYRLLQQYLFRLQCFAVLFQEPWQQFDWCKYKTSTQQAGETNCSNNTNTCSSFIEVLKSRNMSSRPCLSRKWEEEEVKDGTLQFVIEADLWSQDVSSATQHVEADVILWTRYIHAWFIWRGHGQEAINPPPDQSLILIRFSH